MSTSAGESASAGTPPARTRVPAVLVMHAGLAQAMIDAASYVYGPVDGVEAISNTGLSREELQTRIVAVTGRWPEGGLVLTDFWGGSCHTSGVVAALACQGLVIVTGTNLSLLLDYLHNRDVFDAGALAERLQQKGRDAIRVQRGPAA